MGFFYTNATPSSVLTVMDTSLAAPVPRDVLLRAPILAVFPTADAAHALILHDALNVEGSHFPAAVSLAPIALTLPPKIVGLDAPVISVAVAPAGDHVLVAAGDDVRARRVRARRGSAALAQGDQDPLLASLAHRGRRRDGAWSRVRRAEAPRRSNHLRRFHDRASAHCSRGFELATKK